MAATQPGFGEALNLATRQLACTDEACTASPPDPTQTHSRITGYHTTITLDSHTSRPSDTSCPSEHSTIPQAKSTKIGHIISYTLPNPLSAESAADYSIYQQCITYDDHFSPSARLRKVENYITNESFYPAYEEKLQVAERLLYVQEVWLDPTFRRRGLGRQALRRLIDEVYHDGSEDGSRVGPGVVLLEFGPIGSVWQEGVGAEGGMDAAEKIERCWRRMGFEAWSESDPAWLCLGV